MYMFVHGEREWKKNGIYNTIGSKLIECKEGTRTLHMSILSFPTKARDL